MISLDEYILRSDDVAWRTYDGEVVIISGDGSQIHSLNKVASLIWELADGKAKVSDIIMGICTRFEVEEHSARLDAVEFIQKLMDMHLVQLADKS